MHRYRGGHGFESRSSLEPFFFFRIKSNCSNCYALRRSFHSFRGLKLAHRNRSVLRKTRVEFIFVSSTEAGVRSILSHITKKNNILLHVKIVCKPKSRSTVVPGLLLVLLDLGINCGLYNLELAW